MSSNRHLASSAISIVFCLALFAAPAWGQGKAPAGADAKLLPPPPVQVTVSGNQALATISISGIEAEFSLSFAQPENLSAASLGITARLVDPLDPQLLARLPDLAALSIPAAMPLLISVEPSALQGLAFSNVAAVELHTHALPYAVDSPLRLYKAPPGGQFYDITADVLPGSVRTRGHTGGFSDFLVLVDLTPSLDAAEGKYDYLEQRLLSIGDSAARSQLQADLGASRAAFDLGNHASANTAMATFQSRVQQYAGSTVPNRWRAQRDLDNIAGDLLGESGSLRFNLRRLGG